MIKSYPFVIHSYPEQWKCSPCHNLEFDCVIYHQSNTLASYIMFFFLFQYINQDAHTKKSMSLEIWGMNNSPYLFLGLLFLPFICYTNLECRKSLTCFLVQDRKAPFKIFAPWTKWEGGCFPALCNPKQIKEDSNIAWKPFSKQRKKTLLFMKKK